MPADLPPPSSGPSSADGEASTRVGSGRGAAIGIDAMGRRLRLDQPTSGSMRGRAALSTVGIGAQGGLRFASSVFIGRIGGDAVLGVVNSAISAAMFLTLLGPQSIGNAASKFVARARGAGRYDEAQRVAVHLARRLLLLAVVLAALAVVSWAGISGESLSESWRGGLCVAALVVGYAGYSFVRGLQFGAGQVPRATAWDVASVAIGLIGLLALLAIGVRSTTLLLPLALAYLVYTAAGWPRAATTPPLSDRDAPGQATTPPLSDRDAQGQTARPDDSGSLNTARDTPGQATTAPLSDRDAQGQTARPDDSGSLNTARDAPGQATTARLSDRDAQGQTARPDDSGSLNGGLSASGDPMSLSSHADAVTSSPGSPQSAEAARRDGASSGHGPQDQAQRATGRSTATPLSGTVDAPASTDDGLDRGLRREMDHFVLFGIAGAVAVTGFLQLSMVVARLVDSDAQAGQYAAALSLATPASLLAGSMSLVLFPAMAEAWGRDDHEGFRRQGDHAMRLLVLIMVAVFGALVLVSRPLVRIVYGTDYAHAADLLPWLLFAVLTISVGVAAVTSLTTRSQRGVALSSVASAVGLLVGGIVWAIVAPGEGVRGVAIGYLVGTVVGSAVPVVLVWRQDRQTWAGLMLRGAAGVAVLLGLLWLEHQVGVSPFTHAAGAVAALSGDAAAHSSTFTLTFDDTARVSAWWLDPLCATGFVLAWLAISWPDARRLLLPLLRRR